MSRKNKVKKEISATQGFHMLFWSVMCLFLVAIPLVINNFMVNGHIPTANDLGNAEWLSFWGGYLGSAFGVIASLFAFMFTYIQNEKQHKQTREEMKEQNRLQLLPLLNIEFRITEYDKESSIGAVRHFHFRKNKIYTPNIPPNYFESYLYTFNDIYFVKLKNIGLGPACNCEIQYRDQKQSICSVAKDQIASYFFILPKLTQEEMNSEISFTFSDAFGNTYMQKTARSMTNDKTILHIDEIPKPLIL